MKLSAIVLTKDEEKIIKECINSLKFCDEIIIIDDFSKDGTVQIANKLGVKVIKRHLNNNWSEQKNFGLKYAKGDWVFFVDSDEIVSNNLSEEIKSSIKQTAVNGFYLKRKNYYFGEMVETTEMNHGKFLRLARKDRGLWKRAVHEYWVVEGKKKLLKNPLTHKPNDSLSEFIQKINKYSTLHAVENIKENKMFSFYKVFFYPSLKFINNFIIKGGFRQGTFGFVLSALMSFHSFLAWSKIYLLQRRKT